MVRSPTVAMLALSFTVYTAALWLGCYLLARQPLTRILVFTGVGLIAYAAALATGVLAAALPGVDAIADTRSASRHWLDSSHQLLLYVPALCWCMALATLAPDDAPSQARGVSFQAVIGGVVGMVLLVVLAGMLVDGLAPQPHRLEWLYGGAALAVLLTLLALAVRARRAIPLPRARTLTLVSVLFFGLGGGLLLLPVPWIPRPLLILAIGADLLVFGWVVAALDAFDAAEQLRADFVRSLAVAGFMLAVFGGQVILAIVLGAGPPVALAVLLLGVIAGAIAIPAFWSHLQPALDRLVFGARSPLAERHAALLAAAGALPRQSAEANPLALSEEAFIAVTRRALSSFGDLPKLAASPLTRLPIIDRRLAGRGVSGDVLERATELKALLAESIARLKPPGDAAFGITDEWRHYNALYFPYVAGLRPYSRRPAPPAVLRRSSAQVNRSSVSNEEIEAALQWFRAQIPERTLHNWQRAAARLVALDLRERTHTA